MKELTEKMVDDYLEKLAVNLENENAFELRKLSNDFIEEAITSEDYRIIDMSLIAYAFSKIIEKPHFLENKKWPAFKKKMLEHLREEEAKERTIEDVPHLLTDVLKHLRDFYSDAGNYATNVIEQARVKQASRLYALGISLSKAADMTHVGKTELLEYIGMTRIHDRPFTQSMPLAQRYKKAREALK
ncbi:hypothetical protein H0N95_01600 [Candidatus Micrarchaeota archaeon]|nr:hypothetical protein [Candidatus Micrarchaeota archaeon]